MKLFFTIEVTPEEVIDILEYQDKKAKEQSVDFADGMKKYKTKSPTPPIYNPGSKHPSDEFTKRDTTPNND